jgi:hypothetical protein
MFPATMATRRIKNLPRSALQAEQKIAFVLFVFLAVGGIFFGVRSFAANLYRPIQQQLTKFYTGEDVTGLGEQDSKEREAQKSKDTDQDGLSDYDELYVYKTSPYLSDSDSDTFDDKTEVFTNNDPNCPKEKTCTGAVMTVEESSARETTTLDVLGAVPDQKAVFEAGKVKFQSKAEIEAFFKSATLQEVRNALVESGTASKEKVDAMSDEDLRAFFDQAIGEASASGSLDTLISPKQ